MAAIDKFYTDSYQEYKEFCAWARTQEYTTPRGCRVRLADHIFTHWTEEDFTNDGQPYERPVFNSPTHMDNFLYHNCPFEFIQDWLMDRYDGEGYCKEMPDEITRDLSIPQYVPCTKVKVIKKGMGNSPFRYHTAGRSKKIGGWRIEIFSNNGYFWYNEDIDQWILPGEEDEWTCSTAASKKSVRSIIRKIIRKWKLPVGCGVRISGRLVGDEWILLTK